VLQERHRIEFLRAQVQVHQLECLVKALRAGNVEPVLIKGWVNARHYAHMGLRPSGDIDLCVPSSQLDEAVQLLKAIGGQSLLEPEVNLVRNAQLREEQLIFPEAPPGWHLVELHSGLPDLNAPGEPGWDELVGRGETVMVGETPLRLLAPEDHLRLIAIHFLRHEAERPLWLCDLSAALEARSPDWNWEQCLGRDATRANWVSCALALARDLTGVSLEGTPLQEFQPPQWLMPHVLKRWEEGTQKHEASQPMWNYVRHPSRFWRDRHAVRHELVHRWPSPVFAMLGCKHRLDESPRLIWQVLYFLRLCGQFLAHLPRFWYRERKK
jgi:hypothetical protein